MWTADAAARGAAARGDLRAAMAADVVRDNYQGALDVALGIAFDVPEGGDWS